MDISFRQELSNGGHSCPLMAPKRILVASLHFDHVPRIMWHYRPTNPTCPLCPTQSHSESPHSPKCPTPTRILIDNSGQDQKKHWPFLLALVLARPIRYRSSLSHGDATWRFITAHTWMTTATLPRRERERKKEKSQTEPRMHHARSLPTNASKRM